MQYFTDEQAVEIWMAKWLGVGVQALVERYKRSPFRFYEVWKEEKNVGSRLVALERFAREFPERADAVDTSSHVPKRKVVPLQVDSYGQMSLF